MLQAKLLDCDDSGRPKSEEKRPLLSIEDAMRFARSRVLPITRSEHVSLTSTLGRRLSRPLKAKFDLPPFDQSAMDGYALVGGGENAVYILTSGAGSMAGEGGSDVPLGHAARISTGARIPGGVDRVVLREHAHQQNGYIEVSNRGVRPGANIRLRGEDCREGAVLIETGEKIDPRKMALLAAQGMASVEVLCRPRVAVVSSGNELQQPGELLGYANVYDCNRPMLIALAAQAGADVVDGGWCGDDAGSLSHLITKMAKDNDLIVISGGSSLGDADVTSAAMHSAGAQVDELNIAMKPGKPALIGKLDNAHLIGLPGNPFAAFVSWYTLGRSTLATMLGLQQDVFRQRELVSLNELQRRPGRTEFVPAREIQTEQGPRLEFLGPGGSGRLLPLSRADGLARIESSRGSVLPGEPVSFMPFDDGEMLSSICLPRFCSS